jgi:hypothetical protein
MKRNIGRLDQILRLGIGAVALYLGLVDKQLVTDPLTSYILIGIGVVAVFTALSRFCPLYLIPGINTCPLDKS